MLPTGAQNTNENATLELGEKENLSQESNCRRAAEDSLVSSFQMDFKPKSF